MGSSPGRPGARVPLRQVGKAPPAGHARGSLGRAEARGDGPASRRRVEDQPPLIVSPGSLDETPGWPQRWAASMLARAFLFAGLITVGHDAIAATPNIAVMPLGD